VWEFRLKNAYWKPPFVNRVFGNLQADHVLFDDCVIDVAANYFFNATTNNPNGVTLKNSLVAGQGCLIQANPTAWATSDWNLDSLGGNILVGRTSDSAIVEHTTITAGFRSASVVRAAIDPKGRDALTDNLALA
jgi:hypothetical protein